MIFTVYFSLGIAVLAPRARYSFATAQKSIQKRPPLQLRPVKDTGYPLNHRYYHAAPELAYVVKHVCSDSWHRKPMIITMVQWLAEVDLKSKSKTVEQSNVCVIKFVFFLFLTPSFVC
jgi:hypothetical protein